MYTCACIFKYSGCLYTHIHRRVCIFIQTKISCKVGLITSSGSKYAAENKCSLNIMKIRLSEW